MDANYSYHRFTTLLTLIVLGLIFFMAQCTSHTSVYVSASPTVSTTYSDGVSPSVEPSKSLPTVTSYSTRTPTLNPYVELMSIPASHPPDPLIFRRQKDIISLLPDGSQEVIFHHDEPGPPVEASVAPDCSKLALSFPTEDSTGFESNLQIFELHTGNSITYQATTNYEDMPTWSPSIRELAYRRDASELIIANEDGSSSHILFESEGGIFSLAWSPLGEWIALVEVDSTYSRLLLVDPESGQTELIPTGLVNPSVWSLSWSPDGRKVAFSGDDCDLYTIDIESSEMNHIISMRGCTQNVTWSTNGQILVFSATRDKSGEDSFLKDLYSFEIQSSKLTRITSSGFDTSPQFCHLE